MDSSFTKFDMNKFTPKFSEIKLTETTDFWKWVRQMSAINRTKTRQGCILEMWLDKRLGRRYGQGTVPSILLNDPRLAISDSIKERLGSSFVQKSGQTDDMSGTTLGSVDLP